jgi:hypothetical protein
MTSPAPSLTASSVVGVVVVSAVVAPPPDDEVVVFVWDMDGRRDKVTLFRPPLPSSSDRRESAWSGCKG